MQNMHVLYSHDETWTFRIEELTPGLHGPGPELPGTVEVFHLPKGAVATVALAELRNVDGEGRCGPGCGDSCPHLHRNDVPYLHRGWCAAEVQWSLARVAAWRSLRIPFRGLCSAAPTAPTEFRTFAEGGVLRFTHRCDLEPVVQLQEKVFREKSAAATGLYLGDLPEAQVQVLSRALCHYRHLEVLEVIRSGLSGTPGEAQK